MNRLKLKHALRLKAPWIFNAWMWIHSRMQFNRSQDDGGEAYADIHGNPIDATVWGKYFKRPFRTIDYYRIVFFNRKLAREVYEVNHQMLYENLESKIWSDCSKITMEQFRKDYEKFMLELVLDLMKKVKKLELDSHRYTLMLDRLNNKVFGGKDG